MPTYALAVGITALMTTASILGLVFRNVIYPTGDLRRAFVPNDLVNLSVGLPALVGSISSLWRGKLIGLLLLPGALFFVLYNSIIYVLALSRWDAILPHLALVTMSAVAILGLLSIVDGRALQERFMGNVPARTGGVILAASGFLFFLRALVVLVRAVTNLAPIARSELAVNLADLVITPVWVAGGVLLYRRRALGFVTGLGLLFQASLLCLGLVFYLVFQACLTATAIPLSGVLTVLMMGMIFFIPFILFTRGVQANQ